MKYDPFHFKHSGRDRTVQVGLGHEIKLIVLRIKIKGGSAVTK